MYIRNWENWKNGKVIAVGTGHSAHVAAEREKKPQDVRKHLRPWIIKGQVERPLIN